MAALTIEERLRRYLIGAPPKLRTVVVLSFSHPSLPATRHVWREAKAGQVRTEQGDTIDVRCLNVDVQLAGTDDTLEQAFTIAIDTTDAGDEFREALDLIAMTDSQPVQIMYREYLSDDLLTPQAYIDLEAISCSYEIGAAAISAATPKFNLNRTGDLYSPRDVPMLRAFQ